jgi:hypothetical protein
VEHGRYPYVAGTVEVGGDVGRVACFDLEVELLPQAFRELVGEIAQDTPPPTSFAARRRWRAG